MNVTGIVVEYNPLHNGHVLHIDQTKKTTKCDFLIAVMSGNFVQRGEPAIINKWARTKLALESGVDLVLELPFIYSISSAKGFAFGATSLLDSLGIVNNICFGSESGNITQLKEISHILLEEPEEYKQLLHIGLKEGLSYPASIQKALTGYIINKNDNNVNINDAETTTFTPNNILSIEYIKSLIQISSNIKPYTFKRMNNDYNDENITGAISSATSIRKNIWNINKIKESVPDYTLKMLESEIDEGQGPITLQNFFDIISYKIRCLDVERLKNILDVTEGIENKIKDAADKSSNIEEMINLIKNKRFTRTRLQRILLYILFDIDKSYQNIINTRPNYIRVLGFNSNGKALLNKIKKSTDLKIITNPSKKDLELLKLDVLATDLYSLAYKNNKTAKKDLTTSPVYINA